MVVDKKQAAAAMLMTIRKTDPVVVRPSRSQNSPTRVHIRLGALDLDVHQDAARELYRQLRSLYGTES